jgi:hypothetical protein
MREEAVPAIVSAARALASICKAAAATKNDEHTAPREWVAALSNSACELLRHENAHVKLAGAMLLTQMRTCWPEGAEAYGTTAMQAAMDVLMRPHERVSTVIRSCIVLLCVELRHAVQGDMHYVASEMCAMELVSMILSLHPSSVAELITAMDAYAAADKRIR